MKKKISDKTWIKVKTHYVLGRDTIGKIAEDHEISRKSLERKAKKEGWEYGKLSDEVSKEAEDKLIAEIKANDADIVVKHATQFIGDAKKIRNITVATLRLLEKETKKGKLSKAEIEKILIVQRVAQTTAKTIVDLYMAVRKSLGMDKEPVGAHIEINAQNQTVITDEESAKMFADALER
jgi:hypothetical protein